MSVKAVGNSLVGQTFKFCDAFVKEFCTLSGQAVKCEKQNDGRGFTDDSEQRGAEDEDHGLDRVRPDDGRQASCRREHAASDPTVHEQYLRDSCIEPEDRSQAPDTCVSRAIRWIRITYDCVHRCDCEDAGDGQIQVPLEDLLDEEGSGIHLALKTQ